MASTRKRQSPPGPTVELGGYRIPERTQIYLCAWVTHRDPRFFPQPERFLPERWARESGSRIDRRAYFPGPKEPEY